MELNITTLDGEAKGSVNLSDNIFGLEPRKDLIRFVARAVRVPQQRSKHAIEPVRVSSGVL